MKKKQMWIAAIVLVALIVLFIWVRNRIHFDFGLFRSQLALVDWRKMAIALGCIYVGYVFRSVRWALLLRHNRRVPVFSLIGTQVIGFTAVALIGRVADLVRPYLVTKRTGLELSSQFAVYVVERLFDFGAMGLIVSFAILQVPEADVIRAMSHSAKFAAMNQSHPWLAVLMFRYGALLATLAGALFLVGIRLAGETIARIFETAFGLFSKKLGHNVGHKIRTFHTGLDTIRSFSDLAATASISLVMWALIATAYLLTMRAFTGSPELAGISISKSVLLMLISGGASAFQLPILGWFSQIGVVATAISGLFGATPEASTACGAMLLIVTFLSIAPVGLIWAQFENVSLRGIAAESEQASEGLTDQQQVMD